MKIQICLQICSKPICSEQFERATCFVYLLQGRYNHHFLRRNPRHNNCHNLRFRHKSHLHKNLHHIDDIGIDITKKGIPVVTMDEGGEFKEQVAEVESAEWTLSLDVTKHIEEYWNNYKESGDDNISIECGKYLVDQIFNNTRDDDKVIKKTE